MRGSDDEFDDVIPDEHTQALRDAHDALHGTDNVGVTAAFRRRTSVSGADTTVHSLDDSAITFGELEEEEDSVRAPPPRPEQRPQHQEEEQPHGGAGLGSPGGETLDLTAGVEAEMSRLHSELSACTLRIRELKDKLDDAHYALTRSEESAHRLTASVTDKEQTISKLQAEAQATVVAHEQQLRELRAQVSELQRVLLSKQGELSAAKERVAALERAAVEKDATVAVSNDRLDDARHRVVHAEQQVIQLRERLAVTNQRVETMDNALAKATALVALRDER